MYCIKCGNEIDDDALICPKCGCATLKYQQQMVQNEKYDPNNPENDFGHLIGLGICGALLGIIGLIPYFIYRKKEPRQANAVIVGMVIWLVVFFLFI